MITILFIKIWIGLFLWLNLVFGDENDTNGVNNASEFMPFEEWKRLKVKNETNFKNISQINLSKKEENRYNFASVDCAAKIIKTNEGAKESNSVLKENKDSYLINKCSAKDQFIIIELCQDILIDHIEIGNFEFFSSNFKRFKVSVNERYDEDNWNILGEFEASNSRDLQKFKIINPIIWAKFLKIEILDHYGNEFYCPISLIKVYGKTMLEDFKEDSNPNSHDDDDNEIDECKVNTTNAIPYLGLNEFLNSRPEYCEVQEEEITTANPKDSIYKNIIKRLSLLESNASLSLSYIEEQSKLLSDSFQTLQLKHANELDRLMWNFNQTFSEQMLRLNQFNQFKAFESNRLISNLSNDLSFYKKLLLINFILLTILVTFIAISNEISLDIPKQKTIPQFKVGATKKKYRKKLKHRL